MHCVVNGPELFSPKLKLNQLFQSAMLWLEILKIPQYSFDSFLSHKWIQQKSSAKQWERQNREIPHPGINVERTVPSLKRSHTGVTVWKIYLSVMLSLEITSACKIKHTNTQTQKKNPWRTAKKIKMSISAVLETNKDINLQSPNHLKNKENS